MNLCNEILWILKCLQMRNTAILRKLPNTFDYISVNLYLKKSKKCDKLVKQNRVFYNILYE